MRDDFHSDPRLNLLRRSFEGRAASGLPRTPGQREAAVALLLRPRSSLELLLIRRAEAPGDPWSGHVALPGGRREHHDLDLLHTASRETEEEVGVPLQRVGSFVGALDELSPGSTLLPSIVVAPFVLAVPPDTAAVPATGEVQAAIWVPVDALASSTALSEVPIDLPWGQRNFPCLVYEDYIIWGLTYRILQQFLSVAGTAGGG